MRRSGSEPNWVINSAASETDIWFKASLRYDGCMRLSIDATRCQGHGRCYELAPEVIRASDEGHVDLVATTGDVRPKTRRLSRLSSGTVQNEPSTSRGDQGTPRGDE